MDYLRYLNHGFTYLLCVHGSHEEVEVWKGDPPRRKQPMEETQTSERGTAEEQTGWFCCFCGEMYEELVLIPCHEVEEGSNIRKCCICGSSSFTNAPVSEILNQPAPELLESVR